MFTKTRLKEICLAALIAVIAVASASVLYVDLTGWQDLTYDPPDINVGTLGDNLCCVKSTRTFCKDDPAFACQVNQACTNGQVKLGTCLPKAACGPKTGYKCATINTVDRTVDQCTVTGIHNGLPDCPMGQGICTYNYIAYTDSGAPNVTPKPTLCDSGSQYCPTGQPQNTCD
jgi:hypothetical protein